MAPTTRSPACLVRGEDDDEELDFMDFILLSKRTNALRLEKLVRECLANSDHAKIQQIIDQLCHEFAYAVHQSHARNGGLIGLAAVSIALGSVCVQSPVL